MQASTPKDCEKIAQFDLSRPIITIVIWSITTGTKPSRSGSEVSRAKNVNLVRSRSTVTIVSQHLQLVTKLHSSVLKSGVLTISRHDREHASQARDHQVSAGLRFIKSLGRSRSRITIVSMQSELVTISRLSQKSTLGRSRSLSRSWACQISSWRLADLNLNG